MISENPDKPQTENPDLFTRFGHLVKDRFSLEEDKDDEDAIIQTISRGLSLEELIYGH